MSNIETETYIYLLSAGILNPPSQLWQPLPESVGEDGPVFDVTFNATFRPIDTADFDNATYTLEIVCRNKSELNSGFVYAVDENENVLATIEVPKETWGPIGPTSEGGLARADGYKGEDLYVFRATLTPTEGAHFVGLRVAIANTGWLTGWAAGDAIVVVTEAKVVIHQTAPTKSGVHIPMMTDVNNSNQGYVPVPVGEVVTSVGSEAACTEVAGVSTYADCEESDEESTQNRTIWKYDEAELATLSRVDFDAAVCYFGPYVTSSDEYIIGTPDLSWVRAGLRWCPVDVGASPGNLSGTYLDATVVDGSSNVFTYIEDSDFTWFYDTDGSTLSQRIYLDVASLMAADGHYLYVASNENVTGGENGSGSYHHLGRLRSFSVPAGRTVQTAWIDYSVYIDASRSDETFKATFSYMLDDEANPISIILHDVTADEDIEESEFTWNAFTSYERKSVSLDASLFTSGHEYIARWKSSGESESPFVTDINLCPFVTDITEFTSWNRVTKNFWSQTIFGYTYEDWGTKPIGSTIDSGVINNMARAKLFMPEGSEVYYECCGLVYSSFDPPTDPSWDVAYQRVALWDTGTTDNGIGVATSEEVEESKLDWTTATGLTYRQRTADIAQYLTDQNRYGDYQPDEGNWYWVSSGFIVTHYNESEAPPEPASCLSTSSVTIDPTTMILTGSGEGENAFEWRVVKVSDDTVMDSGVGASASFSFVAEYGVEYQLQFNVFPGAWAFWYMNEASGNRIDATGNDRDLVTQPSPVTSITGKIDNAISLPTAGQFIEAEMGSVPDLSGDEPFFIAIFNRASSTGVDDSNQGFYVSSGDWTKYLHIITNFYEGGTLGNISVSCSEDDTPVGSWNDKVSADEWHLILCYYDGTTLTVELDGVLVGDVEISTALSAPSDTDTMGFSHDAGTDVADFDASGIWTGNDALRMIANKESLWNGGDGLEPPFSDAGWSATNCIFSVDAPYRLRNLEYFMPHELFGKIEDSFFVHCGLTWNGGDAIQITEITNADPAVVTAAAHGLSDGDKIQIKGVLGMVEVNTADASLAYTVTVIDEDHFSIGVDSTFWGEYIG
jgi:hypothetical protein